MVKIDWDNVELGKYPDRVIAEKLGTNRRHVCYQRNKRSIPSFSGYLMTQEGEPCKSIYEAMYDAYLHWKNIEHKHEVQVNGLPYRADFLVGDIFIEIAGMKRFKKYRDKYHKKVVAYKKSNLEVIWLEPPEIEKLYSDCPIEIRVCSNRVCRLCGKREHDLVKGYCRYTCYMQIWRNTGVTIKCEQCKNDFIKPPISPKKYCSHQCYSKSIEFEWPSWEWINTAIQEKSIRQVAFDLKVKPPTLYMKIRRRRERNNGHLI